MCAFAPLTLMTEKASTMPMQTLFENHIPLHMATSGLLDSQAPKSDADEPHPPLAFLLAGDGPHPMVALRAAESFFCGERGGGSVWLLCSTPAGRGLGARRAVVEHEVTRVAAVCDCGVRVTAGRRTEETWMMWQTLLAVHSAAYVLSISRGIPLLRPDQGKNTCPWPDLR